MCDCVPFLRGPTFWIYLGINNSLDSLVRGASSAEVVAVLVDRFWKLDRAFDIPLVSPRAIRD